MKQSKHVDFVSLGMNDLQYLKIKTDTYYEKKKCEMLKNTGVRIIIHELYMSI